MQRNFSLLFASLLALASLHVGPLYAQTAESTISTEKLAALWGDLVQDEPTSTRAILQLAKHPTSATEFLSIKLSPLKLTKQDLLDLIAQLSSDNEQEWRHAYQKLSYYDPRLAIGLEELLSIKTVQEYPARHRLVDILSGRAVDEPYSATTKKYKFIKLNKHGKDDEEFFNFCGSDKEDTCGSSWWAEPKLASLNVGFSNPKSEWTRIIRSLAILESFGTSDANAIIEAVASGHPDAQPTKIALSMVTTGTNK